MFTYNMYTYMPTSGPLRGRDPGGRHRAGPLPAPRERGRLGRDGACGSGERGREGGEEREGMAGEGGRGGVGSEVPHTFIANPLNLAQAGVY